MFSRQIRKTATNGLTGKSILDRGHQILVIYACNGIEIDRVEFCRDTHNGIPAYSFARCCDEWIRACRQLLDTTVRLHEKGRLDARIIQRLHKLCREGVGRITLPEKKEQQHARTRLIDVGAIIKGERDGVCLHAPNQFVG